MAGALIFGRFLDSTRFGSIRRRAVLGFSIVCLLVGATWHAHERTAPRSSPTRRLALRDYNDRRAKASSALS